MKINSIEQTEKTTPWLKMYHAKYEHNGKNGDWYFASRSKGIPLDKPSKSVGVMVVPYHKIKEKLVVIKEFRIPLRDYEYSFPAGLIDDGETPEIAAIRELKEETGLNVDKITLISPASYSSAGLTDEALNIVFVECSGEIDYSDNGSSEDIEVFLMGEKEIETLLKRQDVLFSAKFWCIARTFFAELELKTLKNSPGRASSNWKNWEVKPIPPRNIEDEWLGDGCRER